MVSNTSPSPRQSPAGRADRSRYRPLCSGGARRGGRPPRPALPGPTRVGRIWGGACANAAPAAIPVRNRTRSRQAMKLPKEQGRDSPRDVRCVEKNWERAGIAIVFRCARSSRSRGAQHALCLLPDTVGFDEPPCSHLLEYPHRLGDTSRSRDGDPPAREGGDLPAFPRLEALAHYAGRTHHTDRRRDDRGAFYSREPRPPRCCRHHPRWNHARTWPTLLRPPLFPTGQPRCWRASPCSSSL